jgi:hypothetical protein
MKKMIFTLLFFTALGVAFMATGCKKKNATCLVSCQIFDGTQNSTQEVTHTGTMSKKDCQQWAKDDQAQFESYGYQVTCTEEFNP